MTPTEIAFALSACIAAISGFFFVLAVLADLLEFFLNSRR